MYVSGTLHVGNRLLMIAMLSREDLYEPWSCFLLESCFVGVNFVGSLFVIKKCSFLNKGLLF